MTKTRATIIPNPRTPTNFTTITTTAVTASRKDNRSGQWTLSCSSLQQTLAVCANVIGSSDTRSSSFPYFSTRPA